MTVRGTYGGAPLWWQAFAMAAGAHGAVAAALIGGVPGVRLPAPEPPPVPAPIEVSAIALDQAVLSPLPPVPDAVAAAPLTEAVTPLPVAPEIALTPPAEPAQPVTAEPAPPPPIAAGKDSITPPADLQAVLIPPGQQPADAGAGETAAAPDGGEAQPGGEVAPDPAAVPAPDLAPDPALTTLVDAIRGRVSDACLIALPQATATGGLELAVLGGDGQPIADFLADMAGRAPQVALAERSVLVDARQCPALAFARTAPRYPAYPLTLALEAADLASGGHLRGSLAGEGAETAALLLIDDNGVVQDLTRFATGSGPGSLDFDVPMRRAGPARDTSQLLIALAGTDVRGLAAPLDGRLAADAFARLPASADSGLRLGIAPFHIR